MQINYSERRFGLFILGALEDGKTPAQIASESYLIYSNPEVIMDDELRKKVYDIMISEAGDEFEMSAGQLEEAAMTLIGSCKFIE